MAEQETRTCMSSSRRMAACWSPYAPPVGPRAAGHRGAPDGSDAQVAGP